MFPRSRFTRYALAGLTLSLLAVQAQADTFIVTTTQDDPVDMMGCTDEHCTLREAINASNSTDPGAGLSNLIKLPAADQDYVLSIQNIAPESNNETGDLDIFNYNLVIEGDGAEVSVINANQIDRVIHILYNEEDITPNVTLRNLSITGGSTPDEFAGGGINVDSLGNQVIIENCSIYDNVANNSPGGGLNFSDSLESENTFLEIKGTTFSNNRSEGDFEGAAGGAIALFSDTPVLNARIFNSTFSGNQSISLESSESWGGAIAIGGAVNLVLSHTTITANSASSAESSGIGGGIAAGGITEIPTVSYFNSIIAGNQASSEGPDCGIFLDAATIQSLNEFSIVGSLTDCGATAGNLEADPLLADLANNGGSTQTHALLTQSPAINFVPVENCVDANLQPLPIDQRGITRPQQVACDAGAYEANCGDGIMQGTEQCDDGNDDDTDGCTAECTLINCGNGELETSEQCDDGNTDNFDGCSSVCEIEFLEGSGEVVGCQLNQSASSNWGAWVALASLGLAFGLKRKQNI